MLPSKKLRVLMYHSVSDDGYMDELTVGIGQLEQHFQYLQEKGYQSILLSELIAYCDHQRPLPPNPVLITFDDGFRNNYLLAWPLAEKYQMKLNFFLVPAFIKSGQYRDEACMSEEDIRNLDPSLVEIGLHSYAHASYADLIPSRIATDIERCQESLRTMGIPYQPCLAYPYGAYPKRKGYNQDRLFEILEEKGIRLAFRIGNRINRLPLRQPFLIQRLDIKGNESFGLFRLSLAFGRKFIGIHRLIDAGSSQKDGSSQNDSSPRKDGSQRKDGSPQKGASPRNDKPLLKMLIAFCLGVIFFFLLLRLIRPYHRFPRIV